MSEPALSPTLETAEPAAFTLQCALCSAALSPESSQTVNGQRVCDGCATQIAQELAAEQGSWKNFPLAFALGGAAALISAMIWTAIVVITDYEVGYVAVGVGFLCGLGVKLGAGAARSKELQVLAATCSVGGLLLAKYFTFAHFFIEGAATEGVEVGYLSPLILGAFPEYLTQLLSPFDLLWVALAIMTAWKIPAPAQVTLE